MHADSEKRRGLWGLQHPMVLDGVDGFVHRSAAYGFFLEARWRVGLRFRACSGLIETWGDNE